MHVTHFWPVCSSDRHTVTVLLADWLLRDERCFVFSSQEKLLTAAPQTCQGFSSGTRYNRIVKIIVSQDPEEHTAGQRLRLVALGGGGGEGGLHSGFNNNLNTINYQGAAL